MTNPETRKRLATFMDQRRLDLRLTWREVAETGGISYEALRAARNGEGGMRPLTQAAIENGLQWERGSVARILAGGDPVPLRPAAPPGPPRDDQMPPLLTVPDQSALEPFVRSVWHDLWQAIGQEPGPGQETPDMPASVLEAIDASLPAAAIFTAPHERDSWGIREYTPQQRVQLIAVLRSFTAGTLGETGRRNAVLLHGNSAAGCNL